VFTCIHTYIPVRRIFPRCRTPVMYVCMYVCMHVYMCFKVSATMPAYASIHTHTHTYIYVCVCLYVCVCVFWYTYVHLGANYMLNAFMYMRVYMNMCIYAHVSICMHTYIHKYTTAYMTGVLHLICTCIYMHVYIRKTF
jgi:hypothetical protein